MKFTILKSKLSGYLQAVLNVTPAKPTLPILSNIFVEALDQKLKISATDLDISITVNVECAIAKKGAVAVPARILHDIIREQPEGELTVEQSGSRIEIKAKSGVYKIGTVAADDFPTIPAINLKKQTNIPSSAILSLIKRVTFAASNDETRPALNGTLWQLKNKYMAMVATDGHRLARSSAPTVSEHDDIILPPKALNLVSKFIDGGAAELGVVFGDTSVAFNLGDVILSTRLIDGPYPNYEQVIPQSHSKTLRINREGLATAVRRVAILSNTLTHQIKFTLGGKNLKLSTTNADLGGEAEEALACDYTGEPLELGYNSLYIMEILARLDTEDVIFELESPISAGVIYGAGTKKDDYLCLIMPLRLTD